MKTVSKKIKLKMKPTLHEVEVGSSSYFVVSLAEFPDEAIVGIKIPVTKPTHKLNAGDCKKLVVSAIKSRMI